MTTQVEPLRAPQRLVSRRLTGVARDLARKPGFVVAAAIFGFWLLCAAFGELLAPHDPYATAPANKLMAPSAEHWFGTDTLGRDVFARVVTGARSILTVSLAAAALATALGTLIGLAMGYFGGMVDEVLSRIAEAVMALPNVITALLALTALGPSALTLIVVVGGGFAWVVARTVRAAVLTERDADYVAAARVRGESNLYIMVGEILPNVSSVILVEFTQRIGLAIFSIASLSFLGFGIQPPSPDWGLQIADAYPFLTAGVWWASLFPALAIASLVVSVYLIAEFVSEVLEV